MNYQKIYNNLIQKRRIYQLDKNNVYCECHHILPRSLHGSNDKVNLVNLTAREHYIAHRLLEKITCTLYGKNSKEHGSMLNAIWLMQHDKKHNKFISSTTYEYLRIERSKNLSIQLCGQNNPMYGHSVKEYMSKEKQKQWKENISKSLKGRSFSKETIQKIQLKNKGKKLSDETKHKISIALTGIKQSQETIQKRIATKKLNGKKVHLSIETKKKISINRKGKCIGNKNGCYGRKWMYNPKTQVKVYAKKDEIQQYLDKGFIFGVNDITRNKNKGHFIIENGKRKFIPITQI